MPQPPHAETYRPLWQRRWLEDSVLKESRESFYRFHLRIGQQRLLIFPSAIEISVVTDKYSPKRTDFQEPRSPVAARGPRGMAPLDLGSMPVAQFEEGRAEEFRSAISPVLDELDDSLIILRRVPSC